MKLVIGLGNPGAQYAETRHNIGWMVLDRMADRAGRAGRGRQRDASEVLELRWKGTELILAKPLTYMNDSGIAVRKLMARNHIPMVDMLVIADDFALPFGKLRFREAGSHGGHNGLRSIIDELGSEKFSRLRLGIGEPGRGAIDHVLSRFASDERACMPVLLDAGAEAVEAWAREGTSKAANRFNAFDLQCNPGGSASPGVGGPSAPAPGEPGGPADDQGVRRTKTGWAQDGPAATIRARAGAGDRPVSRPTDLERKLAEKIGREWAERRAAAEAIEREVDPRLGVGRGRGGAARPDGPGRGVRADRPPRSDQACRADPLHGPTPRVPAPDSTAAPHPPAPRTWARSRAARAARRRRGAWDAREARRAHVRAARGRQPAAAIAMADGAERIYAGSPRDVEIGDRVADELGAWLGDATAVAVLELRTASPTSAWSSCPMRTAARVAALSAWRSGKAKILVASVQGAAPWATISPADLAREAALAQAWQRARQPRCPARRPFDLGYARRCFEVVAAASLRGAAYRSTQARRPRRCLCASSSSAMRSTRCGSARPRTRSAEAVGEVRGARAAAGDRAAAPEGRTDELRARLGKLAKHLPERLALDLARFAGEHVSEGAAATSRAGPAGWRRGGGGRGSWPHPRPRPPRPDHTSSSTSRATCRRGGLPLAPSRRAARARAGRAPARLAQRVPAVHRLEAAATGARWSHLAVRCERGRRDGVRPAGLRRRPRGW
ncbi:MAG: aminoacyl-tRNA hydrolase [Chloroflexota bacterium]